MAYELENIELKITDTICLEDSENIDFDGQEFLKQVDIECAKVKRAFKSQVVSFESDEVLKRYFHFHQESLIDLINTIHISAHPCRTEFLNNSILPRLSALLSYIEEHFSEYFDLDMKVPVASMNTIASEIKSFINYLNDSYKATNVDIGLVELVKNAVERAFLGESDVTFRQYYYFRFLRNTFSTHGIKSGSETMDAITLLMHCNFNDDSFFQYLTRYINWSVNKAQSIGDKIDQLAFFLKFANQETSVSHLSFDHDGAPINIRLADWIIQEVQYLKHKQQLSPISLNAEDAVPTDFKLNFDLSVSILAYLFRAFTETGVIQNKNASEVIRFLTKYAKTKRSESISYESFRIKYYSVESGTKDAAKKVLQSVLNFMNKN